MPIFTLIDTAEDLIDPEDTVELASTAIQAATYDASNSTLTINFASGGQYVYGNVPKSVFLSMQSAVSVGSFFNKHIRNNYSVRRG